jgi:carboxypeptidase PM20D1
MIGSERALPIAWGKIMKRVILVIVAVIVVLLAVVIGRTAMLAQPPAAAQSTPPVAVNAMGVAQHLAQAVRFQTISYGSGLHEAEKDAALDAMRAWLAKTYPNFHRVATREVIGKSLLFAWKGENPNLPPVLLMAHMDVVPVVPGTEKDWSHPPFAGDVSGGYVWGRGAIDDKGCLIMIMEAAERLASMGFTPARTIMIAAGQDEEVGGSQGNAVVAALLAQRHVHFAWVLDEGGQILDEPFPGVLRPMAAVAIAEKGYLSLELVAHGEGGHSSRPTHDMAVVRLAQAVLSVVDHPFASGLDDIQREKYEAIAPFVPFAQRMLLANLWLTAPIVARTMETQPEQAARLHTTIAPTILTAGIKDNVIPPDARATINFRLHPRDTIDGVIEHVRKAVDDPKVDVVALNETQSEASKVADIHGRAYTFLAQEIQRSFNGIPVTPDITTGATDSRHYMPIADDVLRLDPFHFAPDDLHMIHGTNERLAIRDIAPAVAFYIRLIKDWK